MAAQRDANGLREDEVSIDDVTLETVVSEYTRRPACVSSSASSARPSVRRRRRSSRRGGGSVVVDLDVVRDALGRQRFYQEVAERTAVPGVSTGLAVTGTGGDILFIEATRMKGDGKLVLTGQLGDVMKESAQIALYIHRTRRRSGSTRPAYDTTFHVHVPAGAIPKDGPSAGIAISPRSRRSSPGGP